MMAMFLLTDFTRLQFDIKFMILGFLKALRLPTVSNWMMKVRRHTLFVQQAHKQP